MQMALAVKNPIILTCFLLDSELTVEDGTLRLIGGQETEPETELAPGLGWWSCLIWSAI